MVVLENQFLKVTLSSKGAEITSLIDKATQTEYIWQADENIWNFHAPNLFPVVGGLNNNTLYVNGESYPMSRHGFARNSVFRRLESAPDHAKFSLDHNEETLKVYPFKFEFQVVYHLSGRSLKVMYKVINKDEKDIYFSLGAHPAFNVPLVDGEAYEDYYFQFEVTEDLNTHLLSDAGLLTGATEKVFTGDKLRLTKDMFNKDALIFKDIKSRSVTLTNTAGTKHVKVDFPHFIQLGLWSKPGAPFVCIEPWLGHADYDGDIRDVSRKEAIQHVEHGHVFEADFTISV
jgi:galactose mutarotase-like enzyme